MIKVRVKNIGADSLTGSPVLLLENVENTDEIFPIWIGVPEAENIILHQAGIETPRPLTYDLMKSIIKSLDATVDHVAIIDKRNNIYIAEIVLKRNGEEIKVDSRPSDAVNIALRFDVPIYLNENVVQKINLKDLKEGKDIDNKSDDGLDDISLDNEEMTKAEPVMDRPIDNQPIPEENKEKDEIRKFLENIKPEDFAINPFKNKREKNK
jgi:bifunctional DNase/RNase